MGERVVIIGTGVMGCAVIKGLLAQDPSRAAAIVAVDIDHKKLAEVQRQFGVGISSSTVEAVAGADLVVLAVKPWQVSAVLTDLAKAWPRHCLLVSIAAGVRIASLEAFLPDGALVVRAMPNTPATIGAGITALAGGSNVQPSHLDRAKAVLSSLGEVVTVSEAELDAVTGLSGSGPAYVYLFIEALIDAGVREGLARPVARQLAVETVLGAAKLVKESEAHPAILKDAVTTPGGTTIAGLAALEQGGFRGLIFNAVRQATQVSRALGKGGQK